MEITYFDHALPVALGVPPWAHYSRTERALLNIRKVEQSLLCSMTGYGEAHRKSDGLEITVSIRAVNNRYLKVVVRAPESGSALEPEVEKVIRKAIHRGTIQANLWIRRPAAAQDFSVNPTALKSYVDQISKIQKELGCPGDLDISILAALPGVVEDPLPADLHHDEDWKAVRPVLAEALEKLQTMRGEDGRAMADELSQLSQSVAAHLDQIRERAPKVVEAYREKIFDRVGEFLRTKDIEIDRRELIKEIAVFADRSDVSEEITRLGSHLEQFSEIMKAKDSPGKKLDFVTQEMFRETNTIGSKANDVAVTRQVVEIKGILERIRELVQNIE